MKLISDIINELMDYEKVISGPLVKTKVLASRIGNNILLLGFREEVKWI